MRRKRRKKQNTFLDDPKWAYGLLVFLAIGLYSNTIGHQYTLDDAIVITENMFTKQGIQGIPGIFSHDTFYGFFQQEGKSQLVAGGRYRPISLLFFALLWELFGNAPWSGHLLNILVYAGLGCLVYATFQQWFKKLWTTSNARWLAWFTAVFFVAHPVHTEAVANIKGLDEQLSLAGGLGALWFVRKYLDDGPSISTLTLVVLCFLFGILSKENALMFVGIIPLSIAFFRQDYDWPRKANPLIFGIGGGLIIYALIRFYLVDLSIGGDPPMELMNNPFIKVVDGQYIPFNTGEWLATVSVGLWTYFKLLFFPHPLTHDYYPRHIEVYDLGQMLPWVGIVLHLILIALAIRGWSGKKWYSYAIGWYLITIFIFSNIPVNLGAHLSERFLFSPSIGCAIALAVLSVQWRQRFSEKQSILVWAFPLAIVLLMSFKTIDRNTVWKNNFTLFTTDVGTSERSAKLRNAVGGEYTTKAGRTSDEAEQNKWARKAMPHLETALDIHPRYKNAWLLSGNAHFYLKEFEEAISDYKKALKIDPQYREARQNLRLAYRDGGRHYGEQEGNLQKSLQWLGEAYRRDSSDYETIRLLGVAYGMSGHNQMALKFFKKAVSMNPESANALYNLGNAYFQAGKPDSGRIYRQKALRINPDLNRSSQ